MDALTSGLWRWTAPHPGWKPDSSWERDVASVATLSDCVLTLIDPLVPPGGSDGAAELWRWIDEAREVRVLSGNVYHQRSAPEIIERAGKKVSREPPPGISVHEIDALGGEERAFYLVAQKALVLADAVIGVGGGEVRVAPASWSTEGPRYIEGFRPSLRRLLRLEIELLLPSHGAPVLANGGRALAVALEQPAWRER